MKLTYPACFYPCEDLEQGYTVEVPDLPGCVSEGATLADALLMATDAASGWVLDELEDGNPAQKRFVKILRYRLGLILLPKKMVSIFHKYYKILYSLYTNNNTHDKKGILASTYLH